jgi:hypothetical protein
MSSNLRVAWQNIIPHCASNFKGFENEVTRVINDITKLGFDLGLKEIEKGDALFIPIIAIFFVATITTII